MRIPKSIRVLMVFVTSVAAINLIDLNNYVEAEWAPKKPAYQLVDANGVLIGVVVTDEKTGPVVLNDTVTVIAGSYPLRYHLNEPLGGNYFDAYFKGKDCKELWFRPNWINDEPFWYSGQWYVPNEKIQIPDSEFLKGNWSFQDRMKLADGSSSIKCFPAENFLGTSYGYRLPEGQTFKQLIVYPNPSTLTWPLRVVPDKEVNGPLLFNTGFSSTSWSTYPTVKAKSVGAFKFSASEPYMYFDVIAKNMKGKTVKTWKNQRTGLWGNGSVAMPGETPQSITKYKFSLIYKGKVVATLP